MPKNYAVFIRPISLAIHLLLLNLVFFYSKFDLIDDYVFAIYLNLSWLLISYFTNIYKFSRNIKITKVVTQLLKQFSIFTLAIFAFFTWTKTEIGIRQVTKLLFLSYLLITFFRALYFYALRRYRIEGGNFKRVIVIGSNGGLKPLVNFMSNRSDFGYKLMGIFSNAKNPSLSYQITNKALTKNGNGNLEHLGKIEDCFDYIIKNEVDEIYCSISEVSQDYINRIIDFADQHYVVVKLIPDHQDIFSKNMHLEYYGFVPVLSIRKLPFDKPLVKFFKRLFDIIFSILIIVFVLSWLTPILYVLIKRESKGPVFFKQVRDGLKGESFVCYKYRSMGVNTRSEMDQTTKGDERITKIGKFIRKTSIDELPQFINVLKGEMSVVGPRPHMLSQSEIFIKIVDKYMVRHFVKPGITGLAQVKGYRGEIETDQDIINRVKYDIFYIENWSFVLDINIIIRTIFNVSKGEEKAY
ncbi:MAG TPA: undecaprenyl-phosphate glucose phosphotransferase [Lutibacter sp.]|nr:undecaprenyl-phosphate glucose phosphotransferase [Lutibacter sp.]